VNLLADKNEFTGRGFAFIPFEDSNNAKCSLQTSSALHCYEANENGNRPWDYHLWVGCDIANPRVLIPGKGWTPLEVPEGAIFDTRMHLTPDQVSALIVHLQAWLDSEQQSFIPQEVAE
jgi:hypothetical protein